MVNNVVFTQIAGLNTAASSVAEPMQQSTAGNNSPNTSHGTQANTSLFTLGHTPIKLPRLKHHLKNYKHKQFLLNGFQHGFQLQYTGPRRPRHANNLQSAKQHPTIINQKKKAKNFHYKESGVLSNNPLFQHSKYRQ